MSPHDMDYEAIQKKLNPEDEPEETTEDLEDNPEATKVDEWEDETEEGTGLEYTGDKEEEEVEEKEEEVEEKVEEKKEVKEEKTADEKIKDDMIKYLEETGDTKYVVRGKELDLRDLSAKELKDRFSKAGAFYNEMERLAEERKQMERDRSTLDRGAEQVQELMRRYDKVSGGKAAEAVPEGLKPNEMDSEEVRLLKQARVEDLQRLDKLEKSLESSKYDSMEQQLINQVKELQKEYPLASAEEVIAVKALYPDADLRTIATNSHNHYAGDEYFDKVLDARPEKARELKEKIIEEYLAGKAKSGKKIPRKKSSSTASSKISTKKTRKPRTFDEIEEHMDEIRKAASFDED